MKHLSDSTRHPLNTLVLGVMFFLLLGFTQSQLAAEGHAKKQTVAALYKQVMPATVEILVDDHLNGTGWIAESKGYVITAAHVVVGDNPRFEVINKTVGRVSADLIAIDKGHDLALLKLPRKQGGYPAVKTANTIGKVGDEIYLLGTPIYRHHIMTFGRIARPTTAFEYLGSNRHYIETVYVNAPTPRGTSGGPWYNIKGEIVGLQSGMMSEKSASTGIAFVIPVKAIAKLLKEKKSARTPTFHLAVEELWEQPHSYLKRFPQKTQGLVVRQLQAHSPLKKAGMADGQVIIAVNDKQVSYRDELIKLIRKTKEGESLKLTYLKPDSLKRFDVTVEPGVLEK